MENIRILMMDGCTEKEAIEHIKRGTIVFDDFEEEIEYYISMLSHGDDGLKDMLLEMVKTKNQIEDWGIVTDNGKTYYIMYLL